jgi:GNAT superfamily N-acetyltransferase
MERIERATIENAEKLRQVAMQAFAEDTELYGASPSGVDQIENHREWILKYHYYKIINDDEIIGGIIVMPDSDGYALGALFIIATFQNQGIGTRSVEFIENQYPTVKKWSLCTAYLNDRVRHFYEGLGYKVVGQTTPGDHPEIPDKDFYLLLFEKRMDTSNHREKTND